MPGKDPCRAMCRHVPSRGHVRKSRVPCAWQMLGQEIGGGSSLPDTIAALGVLREINRQRLSIDF